MLTNSFYPRFFASIDTLKKATAALGIIPLIMWGSFEARAEAKETQTAILAGGCFWCVEKDFERVGGVTDVVSGYSGGTTENPTYQDVTGGGTGHYEVVKINFDPSVISYEKILHLFWRSIDATDDGGQFCDRGHSYKTAIFYQNDAQKSIAEKSKMALEQSGRLGKKIATPILPASPFYVAETYHQDYYKKAPIRYSFYRSRCGRDQTVKKLWGDEAWAAKK